MPTAIFGGVCGADIRNGGRQMANKKYVIMSVRGAKNFMPVIDAEDNGQIKKKQARGYEIIGRISLSGDFKPEYCKVVPVNAKKSIGS